MQLQAHATAAALSSPAQLANSSKSGDAKPPVFLRQGRRWRGCPQPDKSVRHGIATRGFPLAFPLTEASGFFQGRKLKARSMLLISLLATLPAFAADAPKSSPAKPPTTAPIPMPKAVLSGPQVTGLFQVLKADGSTVIGQANWVRINVSGTCGAEAAPPVTPKPPVEMPSDVALLSRWNSFTSDAAFKAATATVVPGTLGKK
jgi:hypothetical protein